MEDDAYCMTLPRAGGSTVEIGAVHTTSIALHRAVMDGENDRVTLVAVPTSGRVACRTLFSQHEFAACEIAFGFGQQNRDLEWEDVLAIEVLV